MANKKWLGVADPIAQVDTITVTAFDVTTTYKITINGDVVSVLGDTDVNTTATNLQVALEASTNPYFVNINWTVTTDTITATAGSAGNPHTAVSSVTGGTGTIGAVTNTTASSGPNDWDVARNWDGGVVPVSTDAVIIENGSVAITHGLDQSSVTLASLTIKRSYTGRIGLKEKEFTQSSDGLTTTALKDEYKDQYLQIGATILAIGENFSSRVQAGSTLIKIDLGSVLSDVTIHQTAASSFETKLPAIQLLGTNASNTMKVRAARAGVGIAVHGFEVSTFSDIDIGSALSGGGVTLGSGVTLTNWSQKSGTHFLNAAATITLLDLKGGTITSEGDYIITTVNISQGSQFFANHIKTAGNAITTLNFVGAATVDTRQNSEDKTFNAVNLTLDGVLKADPAFLTITTLSEPTGPYSLEVKKV